jgi:hypothetical protein
MYEYYVVFLSGHTQSLTSARLLMVADYKYMGTQ